jgi:hypothetical protein
MISRPTVFILGAGAIAEYGFPVGYRLYDKICRAKSAPPPLPRGQERNVNLRRENGRVFQEFCKQLVQSGQLSVDAFLETRDDLVDIGKRAIACGLIPYERQGKLFLAPADSDIGPRWYQLLLAELGNSF